VIRSFKTKEAEAVFNGTRPKGFPSQIFMVARRKLAMLNAANSLDDLKAPPNNKLHPLTGNRRGQHAIWINTQFRICLLRRGDHAEEAVHDCFLARPARVSPPSDRDPDVYGPDSGRSG
jgi:proteic killer suppression protein